MATNSKHPGCVIGKSDFSPIFSPTQFAIIILNHFCFQVIESFMHSHGKHILDNYANSLLAVFQKLISSKALDQHGFQLASIFLHYVNVCFIWDLMLILLF